MRSRQCGAVHAVALALLVAVATLSAGCGSAPPAKGGPAHLSGEGGGRGIAEIRVLSRAEPDSFEAALRCVDQFLMDWMQGDLKDAKQLVAPSQRILLQSPVEAAFFENKTGADHQGFEVVASRRISGDEYAFSVWMYVYVMGAFGPNFEAPRPRPFTVKVQQAGAGGVWLLQNVPDLQH